MSGDIITTFPRKRAGPVFDERRGKWRLLWGNETFYDDKNQMIEFSSEREALDWWALSILVSSVRGVVAWGWASQS